ncbi:MAG TPA: hypothetical protein VK886_16415 [Vicinamibacterales bacterium]|nr:hypothetical protein [Vicinamibacterales bacterium]
MAEAGPIEDRRDAARPDRRAARRGGRRAHDAGKPWWMRRRLWLAIATFVWVGWRRLRHRGEIQDS